MAYEPNTPKPEEPSFQGENKPAEPESAATFPGGIGKATPDGTGTIKVTN